MTRRLRRNCGALAALLVLLPLAGCERQFRNMYDQPKLLPGDRSPLFAQGPASRPPPEGSVAQSLGEAAATSGGRQGDAAARELESTRLQQHLPAMPGRAMLLQGQERYTVYCLPCHGAIGNGDGMAVRRGFPAPPTYHQDRLREAPDRYFYDVITNGYGVMYPYADRVSPQDRWAIVAYVRALQTSQFAQVAALPAGVQARLAALPVQDDPPADVLRDATGWRETSGGAGSHPGPPPAGAGAGRTAGERSAGSVAP